MANLHLYRSAAEIGFGRQMDEQHAGRASDGAGAMAAAADIVGEEHLSTCWSEMPPPSLTPTIKRRSRHRVRRYAVRAISGNWGSIVCSAGMPARQTISLT